MDVVARHLAAIDRLRTRDLPAGGAGHHTVELETGHGPRPAADDVHALREAIAQRLGARWGETPPWGQLTLRLRLARGEEIPEPWATLCLRTDELDVWQAEEVWLAVGVADRDEAEEIRLFATVTRTAPP
ncbi:hypothetical protein E5082_11350 [Streptomyces griseoluteus]|uniref:Uncharacterized protein n=1 Tax=Streptomyces griseoluteus TaxID=29306 RepID=A0A4Z1DL21_STRGP|nr:hypothetical protein [Streptomyces griseoluteus]TGN84919.1 hypothetical protein E5082_11350 [Streptomyces griseoluteus]GHF02438.1 hypothetical protein GCM10017776_19990 [Streptomyces griseoluteus]